MTAEHAFGSLSRGRRLAALAAAALPQKSGHALHDVAFAT